MKQMEEEKTMAMATVSKYKVSSYSNLVMKNDGHIFITVLAGRYHALVYTEQKVKIGLS